MGRLKKITRKHRHIVFGILKMMRRHFFYDRSLPSDLNRYAKEVSQGARPLQGKVLYKRGSGEGKMPQSFIGWLNSDPAKATAFYSDGTTADVTSQVSWSSVTLH